MFRNFYFPNRNTTHQTGRITSHKTAIACTVGPYLYFSTSQGQNTAKIYLVKIIYNLLSVIFGEIKK